MSGFVVTVTDAGRAALVTSDNMGTNAQRVVEIGLATAPFEGDKEMQSLPNELKRIKTFAGELVSADTVHVSLQDETADQFTLYGFGLYLENNVLAAVYGQATPIMEKSPDALLMLSIDIRFIATDVSTLTFESASFSNPPATTERKGVVELATQAEVDEGSDDVRAITPKTAAVRYAALGGANFTGPVTAPTPPSGDSSNRLATTEFVVAVTTAVSIGQIVMEPRATARAGFLKLSGTLVNRTDYPSLWLYAQASGALVSDADWQASHHGCFSTGDGSTTFRIPDVRGEFLRCWDDGRGIDSGRVVGTFQGSQNLSHAHSASASEAGEHGHNAWTDAQGHHAHDVADPGHNHHVNDPGHAHGVDTAVGGGYIGLINLNGGGRGVQQSQRAATGIWLNPSGTGIGIHASGAHSHGVGIGPGGNHSHAINVGTDGGAEARPRNIAMLAMIRAY